MKTPSLFRISFSCLLTILSVGFSRAAMVTFAVDPTRSSLTVSGTFQGAPFSPQSAGSLMDSYAGTITGDLSGSTITFTGGSAVTAQPHPNGALFIPAGTGVTNYGGQISAIPGQVAAYRNIVLDFTVGSATHGVAGGESLAFSSGKLDYAGPATGTGSLSLVGLFASNNSTIPVSLVTAGQLQTLTIPIMLTFDDGAGLVQTFDGTIVGLHTIPEPSLSTLFALGACLPFLAMRRRIRGTS